MIALNKEKFWVSDIKDTINKIEYPIITIEGNEELTVENHRGIIELCENRVKIASKIGIIEVNGFDFEVLYIGECTLVIGGKIKVINVGKENND